MSDKSKSGIHFLLFIFIPFHRVSLLLRVQGNFQSKRKTKYVCDVWLNKIEFFHSSCWSDTFWRTTKLVFITWQKKKQLMEWNACGKYSYTLFKGRNVFLKIVVVIFTKIIKANPPGLTLGMYLCWSAVVSWSEVMR